MTSYILHLRRINLLNVTIKFTITDKMICQAEEQCY